MEAVSAYAAVNSNWWLRLGRQREVFGRSSNQSLSLSIGGVGCCNNNWSSRKRRTSMIMNCTRGFRLESSSMGPTTTIERRQRFNLGKGRFHHVMAEAAASATSGSGSGSSAQARDVENIAFVLPYVGVACLMLGIGYHLGYLLSSNTTTGITSTTVAARVLVVAANIIGTTIASSLLDKLGCKGLLPTRSFSRMINFTTSSSLLSNVRSSDDVDTFARVIALKTEGVPLEMAQCLVEETKDIPQSKFDSLVKNIRLDEQHKKETKALRMDGLENWLRYSVLFCILVICLRFVFFCLSLTENVPAVT